jgi:hypothetical protein
MCSKNSSFIDLFIIANVSSTYPKQIFGEDENVSRTFCSNLSINKLATKGDSWNSKGRPSVWL